MNVVFSNDFMKKIINLILFIYIVTLGIPIGTIYGFDYSKFLFVIFIFFSLVIYVKNHEIKNIIQNSIFEIMIFFIGLFWLLYGYKNGFSTSINFYNGFFITPVLFLNIYFLNKFEYLNVSFIIKSLYVMVAFKILEKMFFEFLFLSNIKSYEEIREIYFNILNTDIITMTFNFGKYTLMRMQNTSDAIVFSLFPFLLIHPKINKKNKIIFFLIIIIFTLIVYSRIYMVQFLINALILLIYYRHKIFDQKTKIILLIGLGIIILFFSDNIFSIINERFLSDNSIFSDTIRDEQSRVLIEGFYEHPLIGHGMGSYVLDYIRSTTVPFSYEKEYLSFLFQFGVIGFIFIVIGTILIYVKGIANYFKKNSNIVQIFTFLGFAWFIIRPLFNPSFIGITNCFSIIGIFLCNVYNTNTKGVDMK